MLPILWTKKDDASGLYGAYVSVDGVCSEEAFFVSKPKILRQTMTAQNHGLDVIEIKTSVLIGDGNDWREIWFYGNGQGGYSVHTSRLSL